MSNGARIDSPPAFKKAAKAWSTSATKCRSQVRHGGVPPARRPSQENRNPQLPRCATTVDDLAYPDKTRSPRRDRRREANGYRAFETGASRVTCAKAFDQLS